MPCVVDCGVEKDEAVSEHLRWIAVLKYKTDNGPVEVDHHFEELVELDDLVERGPDWNTLVDIRVTLNPHRGAYNDTVEEAAKR
jgi:hypothetical protein